MARKTVSLLPFILRLLIAAAIAGALSLCSLAIERAASAARSERTVSMCRQCQFMGLTVATIHCRDAAVLGI
jgi:hypothetical protein